MFKKLLVLLVLVIVMLGCSKAEAQDNDIKEYYLFRAVTIDASGSSYGEHTNGIDLDPLKINGIFALSLHADTTGAAGVVTFSLQVSDDRTNWVTPTGVSDIVAGFSKASGTSGVDVYPINFNGHIQRYMRVKCLETGGVAGITFTEAKITIQ